MHIGDCPLFQDEFGFWDLTVQQKQWHSSDSQSLDKFFYATMERPVWLKKAVLAYYRFFLAVLHISPNVLPFINVF